LFESPVFTNVLFERFLQMAIVSEIFVKFFLKRFDVGGEIRPATSMLEVSRLISPELLVEIGAVAVVDDDGS